VGVSASRGANAEQQVDDQAAGYPRLVAVLGLAGTGKSEATEVLVSRHGYEHVHFGGIIMELVALRGLPATPANEQSVREELRAQEGMAAVAQRALPRIQSLLAQGSRVVVDGVYAWAEWLAISEATATPPLSVAIHADRAVRKQRLAGRVVRPLTSEEVDLRDQREIELLDKARPIVLADCHVVNNGSRGELASELERIVHAYATETQA
jgi:dephospho-CoA kinase